MIKYRKATELDLEKIWNENIASHPDDYRWEKWKKEYINYNKSGEAVTFIATDKTNPFAEITILFSPNCKAINGNCELANGNNTANMNAFRIEPHYRSKGHISNLVKFAEDYARKRNIKTLTIGVEAKNTNALAIYLHFGFTKFLFSNIENGELILYYSKNI